MSENPTLVIESEELCSLSLSLSLCVCLISRWAVYTGGGGIVINRLDGHRRGRRGGGRGGNETATKGGRRNQNAIFSLVDD